MALLSTGKIIASIATIGVGGSAVAGTYFFLTSGTTIENLIKTDTEKKRTILDNSNKKAKGTTAWNNYKTQNNTKKAGEDAWKLKDWKENGTGMEETIPDSLIEECAKRKEQKLQGRDNEDYKNFVAWCTAEEK